MKEFLTQMSWIKQATCVFKDRLEVFNILCLNVVMWWRLTCMLVSYSLSKPEHKGVVLVNGLRSMGLFFVKLGQLMSLQCNTLLDDYVIKELRTLQDRVDGALLVHPWSGNDDRGCVELVSKDVCMEAKPFASGSIAYVYHGTWNGEQVVVKVMKKSVVTDYLATQGFLQTLLWVLSMFPSAKRAELRGLMDLVMLLLRQQLDFRRELQNWRMMRSLYGDKIVVPYMHAQVCNERVLVMELKQGLNAYEVHEKYADKPEVLEAIAKDFVHFFLTSLVIGNTFHADYHPGNMFWVEGEDGRMRLGMYDFGSIKRIGKCVVYPMLNFYIKLFLGDYDGAVDIVVNHYVKGYDASVDGQVRSSLIDKLRANMQANEHERMLVRCFQEALLGSNVSLNHDFSVMNLTISNVDKITRQICPKLDVMLYMRAVIEEFIVEGKLSLNDILLAGQAPPPQQPSAATAAGSSDHEASQP